VKILIVEDEPGLQLGLKDLFEEAGYQAVVHTRGKDALATLDTDPPALVVLDLGLPDMDGTGVLQQVQTRLPELPVLVLTSRANDADIVLGFKLGAFDYVTKPFSPRVLLARVDALLRRVQKNGNQLVLGNLVIDFDRYEARRNSDLVHLTTREIDLLAFLHQHGGRPVSRHDILDEVWGMESDAGPRTVDTHVALLRKKIEPNADKPTYILSQRGIGYKLVVPE
jgi:DNA-binding response OmpR family regulator